MKTDKQLRRLCVNHWKRMLKLTSKDIRAGKEKPNITNCAFCRVYLNYANGCKGCPIKSTTGNHACMGTPYQAAADLYADIRIYNKKKLSSFRKAVQKEIDFLESLDC
ncbi:MAG: hypothetical protein OEX07_14685 [Gammaproteobacteria bacterium]|nr:hypothetical protein [Gammaproteobacteria bacterium]